MSDLTRRSLRLKPTVDRSRRARLLAERSRLEAEFAVRPTPAAGLALGLTYKALVDSTLHAVGLTYADVQSIEDMTREERAELVAQLVG